MLAGHWNMAGGPMEEQGTGDTHGTASICLIDSEDGKAGQRSTGPRGISQSAVAQWQH